ncbi:WD repeat-containing protein 73-like [Centrocercus urophasianus]|uniref:WD repeat-containing protein 73-like n=1 Tax=Centrocercus urophasianus TaxID=9002 RepID=UPI001C64FE1C|nr:WD repeat-containing protein 73-like [Centrocercus urophasianus]
MWEQRICFMTGLKNAGIRVRFTNSRHANLPSVKTWRQKGPAARAPPRCDVTTVRRPRDVTEVRRQRDVTAARRAAVAMEAAMKRGEEEEEEEEEDEDEEEEEEEWLLQSLHMYEALHAFELQAPTRVIEWALGKRVCVAGYECSGRNEILQLLPPPTLQAKENQGLCPQRDFKVECGGFSNRPVYNLKHVPDTSLLVTSGPPDSSLQVWQMAAEDSDVIQSVGAISTENGTDESWAKIATISARAPWVLHGSRLSSTRITEVESQKEVYRAGALLMVLVPRVPGRLWMPRPWTCSRPGWTGSWAT